jgi:hypothetical protein
MDGVLGKLWEMSSRQELLVVVFVHGWKHSASPGDGNITTFRQVLSGLSQAEKHIAGAVGQPARQVVGIYLGWRGGSMTVPYLNNLTFWDRKNTAQKVGHGGVTEVLSRLEDIKAVKDYTVCKEQHSRGKGDDIPCISNTRLVVVGHSFGGAVVHTALAQILESRFVQTFGPPGQKSDVRGFGNLVVLINPAFEANLFTPLSDMAVERGTYFKTQEPVLLVLTSEADGATKTAFPIGRWLSTFFEKSHDRERMNAVTNQTETIDEGSSNVRAVGHFKPYRTHRLYPHTTFEKAEAKPQSVGKMIQLFVTTSDSWQNDHSGSKIILDDVVLERTMDSAGRNPYLVTYVDKRLIKDHNDIAQPSVVNFIKQMILISSYDGEQTLTIRKALDKYPEGKH